MAKVEHIHELLARSRRLPVVVIGLALVVLAGALFWTTRLLREEIRGQISNRDGEVLYAVAQMHVAGIAEDYGNVEGLEELASMEDPNNQLLVVLKTSRLKNVLGARLFDAEGRFREAFPAHLLEARLGSADLPRLGALHPVSHFFEAVALRDLFYPDAEDPRGLRDSIALLEVNVPLHAPDDRRLLGIAQFLIQGKPMAVEFTRLDKNLFLLALVAFVVGGGLLAGVIAWAFRRLRAAQQLLADRTRTLLKANQELALAAKTSAVGAVTAHLIHGLRNPLSGLQNFVAGLESGVVEADEDDRRHAVASTRRMQAIINQVVSVLKEQEGSDQYEITVTELMEIILGKVTGMAGEMGVVFESRAEIEATLSNRVANLVTLILVNLIHNALNASSAGQEVRLRVVAEGETLTWEVTDQGRGLPDSVRSNLFHPCQSTREGGSGLGLTISKQLANHLGAGLEMRRSSASGCVFALILPSALFSPHSAVASSPSVR